MATEVNVGRVQGAGFFSCSETLVEEGEEIQKGDIRTCYADKLLPKPFSELFDDSDTGYSLAVFVNDSVVDDGGHVFTVTAISGEYENNELVNYLLTLSYRDRFKGEKGDTGERGPEGYGIFDLNGKEVTNPSIYAATSAGESGSSLYGQGENAAPIWASPIITSLNGTKYDPTSTSSTGNKGIYAPTSAGSSGQYLVSGGSSGPSWKDLNTTKTAYRHKFLFDTADYHLICEIINSTQPTTTYTLSDALHDLWNESQNSYCFNLSGIMSTLAGLFQFNEASGGILGGTMPRSFNVTSAPVSSGAGFQGLLMIGGVSWADGADDFKEYQAILVILPAGTGTGTQMYYRTSVYSSADLLFTNLISGLGLTVYADFAEKITL